MQWLQGEIVETRHWNSRLCSLKIDVAQPLFEAGQFTRVGLPDNSGETDSMEARPYSFVNAPHEPLMEIYFNRVPEGSLSNRLYDLQAGSRVWVADKSAGFMVMSEVPAGKILWMLATGTAVGPFISILKTSAPWQQFEKIVLVQGVRSVDELVYLELIQKLQQRRPDQFIKVESVTRELKAGALAMRIPQAIETGELERAAGLDFDPQSSRVMLCGNPGMVQAGLDALLAKGLRKHLHRAPGQVLQEIYK